MIAIDILKNIGSVDAANIAPTHVAEAKIIDAISQGQQGWGVRRDDSIILKLARDLKISLELSTRAESAQKELVGKRLELGRATARLTRVGIAVNQEKVVGEGLKIALENMTAKAQGYRDDAKHGTAAIATLTKQLSTAEKKAEGAMMAARESQAAAVRQQTRADGLQAEIDGKELDNGG